MVNCNGLLEGTVGEGGVNVMVEAAGWMAMTVAGDVQPA
jgi:hypothetical protein